MDKTILRNFAIESRKDLMEKIDRKIKLFFVDEDFKKDDKGDVIVLSNDKHTLTLTKEEDLNRDKLIKRITEQGYEQVVEEAAYTWFNRIIAIRYMEINDFLPLTSDNKSMGIRVLSSSDNNPNPEILKISNLLNPSLDINFDKDKYSELTTDDLKFKYVLLLVCKKLGKVIPQVFDGMTDYIDLLIPDNMLNEDNFVAKLLKNVDTNNFNKVEIIGWLYQYYNQLEKDRVISSKKAYKKNEIAYATQLFTPDWIVKYMVENSLGRYWLEHSSNNELKDIMTYYTSSNVVSKKNNEDPSDITFIDPCCGSGHILVYAFELFYKMYESCGYNKSEIAGLILKNNIFGLEIDERACQLSILSILLKAREYDKNIFNNEVTRNVNIIAINESNHLDDFCIDSLNEEYQLKVRKLKDTYLNAKEIGSLIIPTNDNYDDLLNFINHNNTIEIMLLRENLNGIINQDKLLSKKYSVVVTNPPYLNNSLMSNNIKEYLSIHYKNYKNDLFSAFMIKNINLGKDDSYFGFMTPYVWMFISSYEQLRDKIISEYKISSLIQFEYSALQEATVPICSFILSNDVTDKIGDFYRLVKYTGGMAVQEEKFKEINCSKTKDYYKADITKFKNINGSPIAYWVSDKVFDIFKSSSSLIEVGDPRQGIATSDNNRFLREWFEVDKNKIQLNSKTVEEAKNSKLKWFPYNKGGEFRKWYGNIEHVVNWENDGYEIKNFKDESGKLKSRPQNLQYIFRQGITWTLLSSSYFGCRYLPYGNISDINGMSYFLKDETKLYYTLGLFSSSIVTELLKIINPTLAFQSGDISKIPFIYDEKNIDDINKLVKENIEISKEDWDSKEISWNYKCNPLLLPSFRTNTIKESIENWFEYSKVQFIKLKNNEEQLNKYYLEAYGLQQEFDYIVDDSIITIRKCNLKDEIIYFISYAVGCMFGRYSLDCDGICYAGGNYNTSNYRSFLPDKDNIIPISDDSGIYYDDDIVGRFKEFIKKVFGEEKLNENLSFISEVLGKKGTETNEDTIRRYFVNDFYNDHLKLFQKRPIYWMFDSGKKNGFKCLIYIHRYEEQIVSKIRTKYLHNTLSIYEREVSELEYKINNEEVSTIDKRNIQNKIVELNNKITECNEYEEMVGNVANKMIKLDLDDGVQVNYSKFVDDNGKSILAKIK